MPETQTENTAAKTTKTRSHWLNTRRLEFWIIWPVLLFTALGFIVAPLLVKKLLTDHLNSTFHVQASVTDIDINPFTLGFSMSEFALDTEQGVSLLSVEQLAADLSISGFFRRTIDIRELLITGASANFVQHAPGDSNFSRAFTTREQPEPTTESSDPWIVEIARLGVAGRNITYTDHGTADPAGLKINKLDLSLDDFSTAEGSKSALNLSLDLDSGGVISVNGDLGLFPVIDFDSNVEIQSLSLLPAQAYVSEFARLDIQSGSLDVSGNVHSSVDEPLGFGGSLSISDLELTDTQRGQRFAGWDSLGIDEMVFSAEHLTLEISQISFVEPYGRVDIAADQSTNIGRIFSSPGSGADVAVPGENEAQATPFSISLGGVRVENGSANFSDASLPLTFATEIHKLNGGISAFVSGSSEPAMVSLEGQVDEYGLARIEGAINLVAPAEQMDMEIIFDNLELQSLSPYTVAFAGRRIDEGKLDLELDYQLKNQKMKGENNIVLKDIKLGEKVDHPGAMALPLDLAVALLKGPDGEINIDLPVSGDINDPEFSYGGIVVKALAGLIVKAVASPFRLLGRLLGGDSEDFGKIGFLPGQATLSPPELEKAHQLAEVLEMRPQLNVLAGGVIDPVADKLAMQADMLETLLSQALSEADAPGTGAMLLDQTRLAVEKMYTALAEHTPLAQLQQQFSTAGEAGGAPVLDELAYVAEMKNQLIRAQPVTAEDLEMLASERANAIIEAIREKLPAGIERVSVGASSEVKADDGDWITAELELAAKPAK